MPLSEEELRLLEQMERALSEEDPKFASTLRGTTVRQVARRRAVLAGVAFLVGIAVLMTGAIMAQIPVGVIGFVIMLASATWGLTALRGQSANPDAPAAKETKHTGFSVVDGGKKSRSRSRSHSDTSFMERMEERWRRRRDQGF
ncbi:DUF3040 domain-containing protein [Nocardioides alcanivorans]|uniref:DUF3040 domain-containing protein n=1 Tax=Nocardioides alcanivorans TaxID=2897352 RepID=UPI001F29455B|nr:DUF3040 domain-containing protein [Nocardioides alcanivorans]